MQGVPGIIRAMLWPDVLLVLTAVWHVRSEPPQYEGQWGEIPEAHGQQEPIPDYYEAPLQETTTEFNPWTLPEDSRVIEDDDDDMLDGYRQEWEAEEFQTTTTERIYYTRPSRTRRTWNWTTRPRTTRKMFTGVTYNSSHVLNQDHLFYQTFERNNQLDYYVCVDNSSYYERFIEYRQKQINEYQLEIDKITKEIETGKTENRYLLGDDFKKYSETEVTKKLFTFIHENKLHTEMREYQTIIEHFQQQIESLEKLNKLGPNKYSLQKQISNLQRKMSNTNATNEEDLKTYTNLNSSYHAILNEWKPLVQSLNISNIYCDDRLKHIEHLKHKVFTKDDYENEIFNLNHQLDLLELDLTHDRITIEKYSHAKDTIERFKLITLNRINAVEHLQDMEEERYKSTYLTHSVKTNVTLDHFFYENHQNKTLGSLGDELRNLFNVTSLEYEDDDIPDENCTDKYCDIHTATDVLEITFPYKPENFGNMSRIENEIQTQNLHYENNTNILRNELNTHFPMEHAMHTLQHCEELNRSVQIKESSERKIKLQQYNVDLSEKYIQELKDLEEYVNTVHDKINKTHTTFTQLSDKIENSIFGADNVDRFNHQNMVKIFGIPGNFSEYPTREGENLTELSIMQKIGTVLNKKLKAKKIKTAYQDLHTDYLRPPIIAEFRKYKDKINWIKDYMNFILIKPRRENELPIYTKLKLRPRVVYLSYPLFRLLGVKYRYDRFIVRDDLTDRMNNLILRIKKKMDEKGMRGTSIVFHNNSHVLFRRHFHGRIRRVRYYDNLDQLFEESKENERRAFADEQNEDILPEYLRKRTTSFGKRWYQMKLKRKNFLRPAKKKTTKYLFWAIVKTTTKRPCNSIPDDKKALVKKYKVW